MILYQLLVEFNRLESNGNPDSYNTARWGHFAAIKDQLWWVWYEPSLIEGFLLYHTTTQQHPCIAKRQAGTNSGQTKIQQKPFVFEVAVVFGDGEHDESGSISEISHFFDWARAATHSTTDPRIQIRLGVETCHSIHALSGPKCHECVKQN